MGPNSKGKVKGGRGKGREEGERKGTGGIPLLQIPGSAPGK